MLPFRYKVQDLSEELHGSEEMSTPTGNSRTILYSISPFTP